MSTVAAGVLCTFSRSKQELIHAAEQELIHAAEEAHAHSCSRLKQELIHAAEVQKRHTLMDNMQRCLLACATTQECNIGGQPSLKGGFISSTAVLLELALLFLFRVPIEVCYHEGCNAFKGSGKVHYILKF